VQRVLIVGAGGHAQVVADALQQSRNSAMPFLPVGYVDDHTALHGQVILGLPVLGSIASLSHVPHDAVVIGIGNNAIRRRLFEQLGTQNERLIVVRHPAAVIAPDVVIGDGTVVMAGAIINTGVRIGTNVILNTGCTIDHHNQIGDHAHVAPGAHLGGDVRVGEETLLGIGAVVMPQRHIGSRTIIGAGAVVCSDIPDGVTAVGLPARIIK
jgi:sugar O-acyltransferase (sialic acid O-acetyltransferase NeuD family)